jgi:hypothetical protein
MICWHHKRWASLTHSGALIDTFLCPRGHRLYRHKQAA